ncbi:MAG TPA: hypothetical protein VM452_19580 [Caulifigura sp.]|nr:hypothetical protein [Caulifigura sp.]
MSASDGHWQSQWHPATTDRFAVILMDMAKGVFIIAGVWVLLCALAELFAEQLAWPRVPFLFVSQLVATLICFLASLKFLAQSRTSAEIPGYTLGVVAAVLSGLWLACVGYVALTLDFSVIG